MIHTNLEIMTVYEFMRKPLIEKALEQKNYEWLKQIIAIGDIFNATETIDVSSIIAIKHEDISHMYPVSVGTSCNLYKKCRSCGELKFYQAFKTDGNYLNWRKYSQCVPCRLLHKKEFNNQ